MRRGELCGLRWEDVDLVASKLTVNVQLVQIGASMIEQTAKTAASAQRVLPLGDRATSVLLAWQLSQLNERENASIC